MKDVRCADGVLTVELLDGRFVSVPLDWFPGIRAASPGQRAKGEYLSRIRGIHWPEIDETLHVRDLLATDALRQGGPAELGHAGGSDVALVRVAWPELASLSFPDEPVTRWSFDRAAATLVVVLGGGFLESAGGVIATPIRLTIGPWTSFRGRRHPGEGDAQSVTDPSEPLGDVCKSEFGPATVRLAGFSVATGSWLEYEFDVTAVATLA